MTDNNFQPLQQTEWFGNARGYNISYKEMILSPNVTREPVARNISIEDPTSNSYIVDGLEEFAQYEIVMIAFNDVGYSAPSPAAIERTRESGVFSYPLLILVIIYTMKSYVPFVRSLQSRLLDRLTYLRTLHRRLPLLCNGETYP